MEAVLNAALVYEIFWQITKEMDAEISEPESGIESIDRPI